MTLPINNPDLLNTALTHRSFLNESKTAKEHNERLEYLGDAVLELIVSEYLYNKFPSKPEGELTSLRSALVKTTTLAKIAKNLGLGEKLKMSKGEVQTGGRHNTGLLANTFEAVVGAIYLDSGFAAARDFISDHLFPLLPEIIKDELYRDYKSAFQEKIQALGRPTPSYRLVSQTGPDHDKIFTMEVVVGDTALASGTGHSKQESEQAAAAAALKKLDQGAAL